MPKRLVPTLVLVLFALWPATSVGQDTSNDRWSARTADSVAARESSSTPSARRGGDGSGYAVDVESILDRFTILLTQTGDSIRGEVAVAAGEAQAVSGVVLDVAPGTAIFDESPPEREIHVTVARDSPCGPLGERTVGCGGYLFRDDRGRRTVVAGVVWVAPDLQARGGTVLRDTVLHELGHALGLQHYDEPYNGEFQIMRSVIGESVGGYRSGDRAGLADLAHG